ncbi:MAG: molecular chaperone HtpG, partial [Cyanobacteria bacterium P01_A01_bin.17]
FKQQVEDILIYRTTAELAPAAPAESEGEGEDDAWKEEASGGPSYTTLKEYLERNKERHENRVYYCNDEANQATYVELHKSQGLEVLFLDAFIDTHFTSFLEREYTDVKFLRVDSELDETLIDKSTEAEIVDPTTNQTRTDTIKSLFEKCLEKPSLTIRTEALKSTDQQSAPPAMVLLPESARRMQEMMAMMQQQNVQFPTEHTLLVNTAHPLIQNLASLSQGSIVQADGQSQSGELANDICQHVYDLALMAQRGFDAEGMKAFTERSNKVLTRLTELAAH